MSVRVVVRGVVQGVFFRQSLRHEADAAGVGGWVRNRGDGRVEAHLEGGTEAVEALVAWCRHGPARAVVTDVDVTPDPDEDVGEFRIRHD